MRTIMIAVVAAASVPSSLTSTTACKVQEQASLAEEAKAGLHGQP